MIDLDQEVALEGIPNNNETPPPAEGTINPETSQVDPEDSESDSDFPPLEELLGLKRRTTMQTLGLLNRSRSGPPSTPWPRRRALVVLIPQLPLLNKRSTAARGSVLVGPDVAPD